MNKTKHVAPPPTTLDALRDAEPDALPAGVRWTPRDSDARTALATSLLLDEDLYLGIPIRSGHRYPRQRNYHGFYYFSQTRSHVWHESLLEATTIRWLDMHEDIVAIIAQPMEITFADGTRHIPDYLAMHADQRQVLYDVKPLKFITADAQKQFAKTRAVCDHVGWGYEIHSELAEQAVANLKWLAAFKHPGYHPGATATSELMEQLTSGARLIDAATALKTGSLAAGRSGIYHLIWTGQLAIDINTRINNNIIVTKGRR